MNTPFAPRARLATHDVTNQATPLVDVDLYGADALLRGCVEAVGGAVHAPRLSAFGQRVGSDEVQTWADEANRSPPTLRAFDRFGRRLDEVAFHPAYHALMQLGLEAGVSSIAWTADQAGHVAHAALLFLMTEADAGVGCPMSMTYASVPALRTTPAVAQVWVPRIAHARYDPRAVPADRKAGVTLGMAMTEKQGGSDVRANRTVAVRDADGGYRLTGHKWFCSAPMSDAFLTLAKIDGDDAALTCFLVPRWRVDADGSPARNAIELQRLKDKLGDRSNASSEIEYREASAEVLGEVGQGVRTIIEMVHHTRFDCITSAAAIARWAVSQALWFAQRRAVFGRSLIAQPLARAVFADLALDVAGMTALACWIAHLFDRAQIDPQAKALARLATPIAKYWVCKRCPVVVAEAMEALGGAGYVEESPLPRLYRQAPLNGIWEGSGNVIALDVLRGWARDAASRDALMQALTDACATDGASAAPMPPMPTDESHARAWVERAACVLAVVALRTCGRLREAEAWQAARLGVPAWTFGASTALAPDVRDALIAAAQLQV